MLKQRVDKYYKHIVSEDLIVLYNYKNIFLLPSFDSAVWSSTSKKLVLDKRNLIYVLSASFLALIQKSVETRAHKDIATYQLRKGVLLGGKATLRNSHLSTLLDKLLVFVMPTLLPKTVFAKQLQSSALHFAQRFNENLSANNLVLSLPKATATQTNSIERKSFFPIGLQNEVLYDNAASFNSVDLFIGHNLSKLNNYFDKNIGISRGKGENKSCNANQFTIGHSNLLVFPELKKFFPFFENSGGFSLTVFLRLPKRNIFVQNVYESVAPSVESFRQLSCRKQNPEKVNRNKTKIVHLHKASLSTASSSIKERESNRLNALFNLEKTKIYQQDPQDSPNSLLLQDQQSLSFFCLPQDFNQISRFLQSSHKVPLSILHFTRNKTEGLKTKLSGLSNQNLNKETNSFVVLIRTTKLHQKRGFVDKAALSFLQAGSSPGSNKFYKIAYNFVNATQSSTLHLDSNVLNKMTLHFLDHKRTLFLSAFQLPSL